MYNMLRARICLTALTPRIFRGLISDSRQLPVFRVEKGVRVSDISLSDCEFISDDISELRFENISRVHMQNVTFGCRDDCVM